MWEPAAYSMGESTNLENRAEAGPWRTQSLCTFLCVFYISQEEIKCVRDSKRETSGEGRERGETERE